MSIVRVTVRDAQHTRIALSTTSEKKTYLEQTPLCLVQLFSGLPDGPGLQYYGVMLWK